MDFDQLEAVVASVQRVNLFDRSSYCMDTFMASQADQKGIKTHLDTLMEGDSLGLPAKKKAVPFSQLQSRISALGI